MTLTDDASVGLFESVPDLVVRVGGVFITSDPRSNQCGLSVEKA